MKHTHIVYVPDIDSVLCVRQAHELIDNAVRAQIQGLKSTGIERAMAKLTILTLADAEKSILASLNDCNAVPPRSLTIRAEGQSGYAESNVTTVVELGGTPPAKDSAARLASVTISVE